MSPLREAGRARAPSSSTRSRVFGGQRRHLAGQDVAQHAVALLEHQRLALRRLDQRGAVLPLDAPRPRSRRGSRESTAAPAPSPNRQALISTPGSLSRYIAALLTSTQTDSTCVAAPARDQRSAELQVRQRRGATLADEVEGLHVGAQAEPLDDVAREAGAQIAGAGADDDGVDRRRRRARPTASARAAASAASVGAWARKRRSSVSGSIANTSSSESSASRRASMPLSRCRTSPGDQCASGCRGGRTSPSARRPPGTRPWCSGGGVAVPRPRTNIVAIRDGMLAVSPIHFSRSRRGPCTATATRRIAKVVGQALIRPSGPHPKKGGGGLTLLPAAGPGDCMLPARAATHAADPTEAP